MPSLVVPYRAYACASLRLSDSINLNIIHSKVSLMSITANDRVSGAPLQSVKMNHQQLNETRQYFEASLKSTCFRHQ